jgi:hypothetical protein
MISRSKQNLAQSYHWQQIRDILLHPKFYEIITPDTDVQFFQHSDLRLVKLRKYENGLDKVLVEVICQYIRLPFSEFNELYQKAKRHELR